MRCKITLLVWLFCTSMALGQSVSTFDYRLAEVRWNDHRWELWAGEVFLKDFGRREADARQALRLIQNFRLTQHGTIGTPRPVMEYWLADGKAPVAFGAGLRTEPFDFATLRVQQIEKQWCVRDQQHVLFNFGSHGEEAQQALEIIRHYGFDEIGTLGQPVPTMMYLLVRQGAGSRSILRAGPPRSTTAERKVTFTGGAVPTDLPSTNRQLATPAASARNSPLVLERVPIDWKEVRLQKEGQDWKLVYAGYTLANFGSNESDARHGLIVVQHFRFTEQCLIGRPIPEFSFFLVNGQAPCGFGFGTQGIPFRPETLVVHQTGNHFAIAEGDRQLIDLGESEQEAQQLLQAIRRYRFDHLCYVGSPPKPAMTFLVRTR
jgi:hypothetical protein